MRNVIEKYIDRLTIDDVSNFIKRNNYQVTEDETIIIFKYIKNCWQDIFNGNTNVFDDLKKEVSPNTFLEIMKLYNKYKKWI